MVSNQSHPSIRKTVSQRPSKSCLDHCCRGRALKKRLILSMQSRSLPLLSFSAPFLCTRNSSCSPASSDLTWGRYVGPRSVDRWLTAASRPSSSSATERWSGSVHHIRPKPREEALTSQEQLYHRPILKNTDLDPGEECWNWDCWADNPQQTLQVFLCAPGSTPSLSGLRIPERLPPG